LLECSHVVPRVLPSVRLLADSLECPLQRFGLLLLQPFQSFTFIESQILSDLDPWD
jgi:hypothetical protein